MDQATPAETRPIASPPGAPTLTVEGMRATIRLNRPEVHNRIEPADLVTLTALLAQVEADPALRVLVLAAGGKSFSSGFHIGELGQGQADENAFGDMVDRLEALRLPTICALQGGVYGGSTDLALACDFRIGVTGIRMFMPAARLGLHYYRSGMQRYVSRLGVDVAKHLFLTAEPLDAEAMRRVGFLTELVAPDRLAARVEELAGTLAANAPLAVQGMKRSLNAIALGGFDPAVIEASQQAAKRSADLAEGRAAWLEKRAPRFTGR
ncbi:enoyl-CoA hydratase-related protein [Roseomonas sp. NAR14]|uniref:Enoyl-CoA hydratase-related protein n=1 Tax=Roseomonas acroporae TaxID=2937791 RepID=A0A9X2BWG0_9PROT|nr:enoyl-CoA hydratase-related protein [Roseomonas acroporae]MCK8784919.1 enoyl-CoA hydratase-related protein [Roseomonas acroporae]